MPLLDHFHPPLSRNRHWHSFHNAWATYLAADLNARLPDGYFAEPNVQFGIEIDVAAFEEMPASPGAESGNVRPPDVSFDFAPVEERVEVEIYGNEAGPILAAAIELVSPANKDRREHRIAFSQKCAHLLRSGIGVLVVDVVTSRNADLRTDICDQLGREHDSGRLSSEQLLASSFRPLISPSQNSIQVWDEPLAIGKPLPQLPLWVSGHWPIMVDLEASYQRTCQEQRLLHAG